MKRQVRDWGKYLQSIHVIKDWLIPRISKKYPKLSKKINRSANKMAKDLNIYFSIEAIHIESKNMKRHSTSLVIKKM